MEVGWRRCKKEAFASKGPAGTRPCLGCKNVVQFLDVSSDPYLVDIAASPEKFDRTSDTDIRDMVAKLREVAAAGSKRTLELTEQALGLNFEPEGLLFDRDLARYVRPVSGWYRDWLHVFLVQGIGNIQLQQTLGALREAGVDISMVVSFFVQVKQPKTLGQVSADWFSSSRVGKPSEDRDGWKGFGSELLSIIPIMLQFLFVAVAPSGQLAEHIECFRLLDKMLKLFSLGRDAARTHRELIRRTLHEHGRLYSKLFRDVVKPKFHHMYHLLDHLDDLGFLLNCFVTERKHRSTKAVANHMFRNYEIGLTRDMLNIQVQKVELGELFDAEFLVRPQPLQIVPGFSNDDFNVSTQVQLRCGLVSKGDLIITMSSSVGFVERIVQNISDGSLWLIIGMCSSVAKGKFSIDDRCIVAVESDQVVEALSWYYADGAIVHLPPKASAIG